MFVGVINKQIVCSCHPVFVLCSNEGVAAEFPNLESARRFLQDRGFVTAAVYEHNGWDWRKLHSRLPAAA
jgi:hypothetical protein